MTLDEAIKRAREIALEMKREATYNFPSLRGYYQRCGDCAEEHEQLADWLEELKQLREESKWIPVVMRESTSEEREELKVEMMCDFPLPGDEQEILISSNGRVFIDTCCWDGYDTWLGGSGAWTDVDAWRPLPKAYGGEE